MAGQRRSGSSELVNAVKDSDLDRVAAIINDAPHSKRGELLAQGLCVSCEQKKSVVVQRLLSLGADPCEKFSTRPPPLLIAVRLDLTNIVEQLLSRDGELEDSEIRHTLRRTAVTIAKSRAVAEMLIDRGVHIESRGKEKKTLIMDVGSPEVVRLLIDRHADLEAKDEKGRTALISTLTFDEDPTIAKILIERGANINAKDGRERNVLMTAVWMNRVEILKILVNHEVDVRAVDDRRRNALHHMALDTAKRRYEYRPDRRSGKKATQQEYDSQIVQLLLQTRIDPNAEDELGRTCIHWAAAEGCSGLLRVLFMSGQLEEKDPQKFDINAVERRSKTPLHLAAGSSHSSTVQALLQNGANVNAESDGFWTALHNACSSRMDSVDTVKQLLDAGAGLHRKIYNGRTPLHVAAKAGNVRIVRYFLTARRDIKRTVKDSFGNTPLLCAASIIHKNRDEIVRLLAPWNNAQNLSADAKEAAQLFRATVVDFGKDYETAAFHWTGNKVKTHSVYDLLYNQHPKDSKAPAVSTLSDSADPNGFRWIHLPANNVSWCLDLITKHFIEEGALDVNSFRALERSFNHQHRGRQAHSRYMTPLCQTVIRSWSGIDEMLDVEEELEANPSRKSTFNEDSRFDADGSHGLSVPYAANKDAIAQERRRSSSNPGSVSVSVSFKEKGSENRDRKPLHVRSSNEDPENAPISDVFLFMPYLHFETYPERQEMSETYQHQEPKGGEAEGYYNDASQKEQQTSPGSKDRALFRAYLNTTETSLHIRRTLDQFLYHQIDTRARDQDQVIHRFQKVVEKSPAAQHKVLMVDQLWMWIIGKNLVITSFPQRWKQPKKDPLNVLDSILSIIGSGSRERVRSVYELAMIISGRCYGAYDRHGVGSDDPQFLDMFEGWIGAAMDDEVKLFERFKQDSAHASEWLGNPQSLRSLKRTQERSRLGRLVRRPDFTVLRRPEEHPQTSDRDFVENLLDIGWETALLGEIKDIRDELDMLSLVFQHQDQVLPSVREAMKEISLQEKWPSAVEQRIHKALEEHQRTITQPQKDIRRMESQAKRMYNSIRDLLDLKQKHANAIEARYARETTDDTARQGQIFMVFTIVTVIFLPLSFIAAFFAIDIKELPHTEDRNGNQVLSLAFVSKWTFGIGLSIAVICVVLALSVENIAFHLKELGRRLHGRIGRSHVGRDGHQREGGIPRAVEEKEALFRYSLSNSVLRTVRSPPGRSQDLERDATLYAITKDAYTRRGFSTES